MRRWNGWGDDGVEYQLPPEAAAYLDDRLGRSSPTDDASLDQVLRTVPPSRLPGQEAWTVDAEQRLRHARGQSLPDWVALRSGRVDAFPDGIAYPRSGAQVAELLRLARRHGLQLIPYGGGTSVVGHINPLPDPPSVTVDLRHLAGLHALDEISGQATFGAGTAGPQIESALGAHGLTLGHFPQSFEYSTLGGWVATRSTGQQSDGYGRIEGLFRGGQLETPSGSLELPPHPASAAGPDLRQFVLGSEGRLGILTRVTVRVRPRPEQERHFGVLFPSWEAGLEAARAAAQEEVGLSTLRLSDPLETRFNLAASGHARLRSIAERLLSLIGYDQEKCLTICGLAGARRSLKAADKHAGHIFRRHGGLRLGGWVGNQWYSSRFKTPYLRNTLWSMGYALDTLETALPWKQLPGARDEILRALRTGLQDEGQPTLAFSHLSHSYTDGGSLYVIYIFRRGQDPDQTLSRWRRLKRAASATLLSHGGTISHHHGVGTDHRPYLRREKGPLGVRALEAARRALDPEGVLNPGKLLGDLEDPGAA